MISLNSEWTLMENLTIIQGLFLFQKLYEANQTNYSLYCEIQMLGEPITHCFNIDITTQFEYEFYVNTDYVTIYCCLLP